MTTQPSDVEADVIVDVDHHTDEFNLNELEEWAKLRNRCPVAFNTRYGGFWMVTNYDGVAQVARDDDTFSHRYEPNAPNGIDYYGECGIPRPEGQPPLGVGEVDGTYHLELRRALNPFLSPQAVDRMVPFMEQSVTWFLDQKIEDGAMDLVLDYTSPVPAILTMRMMGLPYDDWRFYADLFHATMSYPIDSEEYQHAVAPAVDMMQNLGKFAAERRADPKDDLTSFLTHVEVEGKKLTDEQILDILWNLIGGGVDTTTSLTSWTLYHLAAHPELRDQLIDQPELLPRAADEFLRYYSVNQTLSRTVTRDVELCGQQLRKNDRVLISWLSANHDEATFEQPDEVVLDRHDNRHLAFGLGPHRCIGSHLARTMFGVMIGEVLRRIPDYQVDVDDVHQYVGNPSMTGLADLWATFTPGPVVGVPRPY
jgi:cytochrome P450